MGAVLSSVRTPPTDRDWMLLGLCRERADRSIFFPTVPNSATGRIAKAVCKKCPVRPECYKFALENDELGIWGGTDEWERQLHRVILQSGILAGIDEIQEHTNVHESTSVSITFSSRKRSS